MNTFAFGRGLEPALVAIACLATLCLIAPIARAASATTQPESPSPDPKLKPQEVVKIVIEALAKNDANDTGIRTTFKFASPANKEITGPVERFIPMVKSPGYAPMIGSKSADYSDPEIRGDQAVELVFLKAADGSRTAFIFQLSRQVDGQFKGCWMTDAVYPVKPSAESSGELPA